MLDLNTLSANERQRLFTLLQECNIELHQAQEELTLVEV